jgi:rhodanese-related sulfurtransferase
MVKQMTVGELKKVLDADPKALLIDVRELAEFREVRAARAQLLALSEFSPDKVAKLASDKEAPIYLICRSGARSMRAAEALEQAGYSNLNNIEGGTQAWVSSGYETSRG